MESIASVEGERSRRRVSMDITVPKLGWPLGKRGPADTAIPLAVIAKTDMRQFDAADAAGQGMPVLATSDNAMLSTMFLEALLAAEMGIELDEADRGAIGTVVPGIRPESVDAMASLVARRSLGLTVTQQYLAVLADNFLLFALLPYIAAGRRTVVKFSYQWSTEPRVTGVDWFKDRGTRWLAAPGLAP